MSDEFRKNEDGNLEIATVVPAVEETVSTVAVPRANIEHELVVVNEKIAELQSQIDALLVTKSALDAKIAKCDELGIVSQPVEELNVVSDPKLALEPVEEVVE